MIDCFLYFSTICYVRLSKITATLLPPRRESERIPLLQERCFPIASAKVGHFRIPCKTSTKKNARKIHLHQFCHFIAWQNHRITHFFALTPPRKSHPSPTPLKKYKPTFSQNFSTFRRFLPCFSQNLPTSHKLPSIPRTGHAPSRTYTPAHSPNFVFCLHSFTSHHNKLYINRLRVKANLAFTFTPTATA